MSSINVNPFGNELGPQMGMGMGAIPPGQWSMGFGMGNSHPVVLPPSEVYKIAVKTEKLKNLYKNAIKENDSNPVKNKNLEKVIEQSEKFLEHLLNVNGLPYYFEHDIDKEDDELEDEENEDDEVVVEEDK
jgi:hypothetical protein